MAATSPARRVATRVLHRVSEDGAWASLALDSEIARARLDRRDAGLATDIVYGTLRVLPSLDAALDRHLAKPRKTDPWLRSALRAGAYQLLHSARVPPHAAVSDAVALVKEERGPRLAGVANAVLRKVVAARPESPQPPTRIEVPPWIARELERSLGVERSQTFLHARKLPPALGLRPVGTDAATLAAALRAARPDAEIEIVEPIGALAVRGAGDPRELPGYTEGLFAVQELGSQRIVAAVGVQAGESIADLCAGHGTKSLAFAERVGASGRVIAVDLYEEKLERIERERSRLRAIAASIEIRAVDLTIGTAGLGPTFDRVIVDAPCTGLGTVHRRPELLLRLTPADIERMAELQRAIVATAARLVRPGGDLFYAVCSPTTAEAQVAPAGFERAAIEGADPDGVLRIGPWTAGEADAYQVLRFRRFDATLP